MLELPEMPSLVEPSRRREPRRAEPLPDPGSRAAEQRAAEHALATAAAEPDPGRARAEPGRSERRAQADGGPVGRPAQLELGLAPGHGRTLPVPRSPPIEPVPLSRSDSRSRGALPPASCLIAPWFAPDTGVLAWLGDKPGRGLSPRTPARRSAAATAYSTNGHSSTS